MAIIKAFTLPHPPLAIPDVGRGKEKEISLTLAAMDDTAKDIAEIKPDTIIYITPHSVLYSDHFHISPGSSTSGDLKRFGCPEVKFEAFYDEELIREISRIAAVNDISADTRGEKDPSLDHGVTVPMWYINKRYSDYKTVRIAQSGMAPTEHYMFGKVIAEAVESVGRRAVIIASSDLSHKLQADAPYGFDPDGPLFDKLITDSLSTGDFLALLKMPEEIRERAGECGYNSLTILAGCFDKQKTNAQLLSYEGPFGVGYAVASFTPTGKTDEMSVLEQYIESALKESEERKSMEDGHQSLARRSLEHIIRTGEKLSVPNGLSDDLIKEQAGVFVSLHKNGKLRGCIGTISPTTKNVAEEIVQNAISAGLSDNRFDPVSIDELPYLIYKVDVLLPPEPIEDPKMLDVKKYGVIVKSGFKRGLLLPNLAGVDTVEEQINIARSKAGIGANENIQLERFEVVRHES